MSYMGDYKIREAEEAEAAIGRAVDEAAALDELSRAKKEIAAFDVAPPDATEQGYEEWQEQQIESLHRNLIAAANGLRSHWGWTKEDLRLALEHEDLI